MPKEKQNTERRNPVNPEVYSVAVAGTFAEKLAFGVRHRIYRKLAETLDLENMESVLDVGATADRKMAYSNYFEANYPWPERVTALSDQDASWMEEIWKGLRFVKGDGCSLPFPDHSFDLVFSSAVIEHVGGSERQKKLISECYRVARKAVFITTPNRMHPAELHTALPFLHWLPKKWHRKILEKIGYHKLAREENLNLLTVQELHQFCAELGIPRPEILHVSFLGFPSNLLLLIRKNPEKTASPDPS